MPDFIKLAREMRQSFAMGIPFKMPLMRFRDLDILFAMLETE